MNSNGLFAKTLRFLGINLMALTGGFTMLGGIGTSCAALAPTKYASMATLAPYQWLYIGFVVAGIAVGLWGLWATIRLIKGTSDAYRMSLQALAAGVAIGSVHIFASRMLRGKSMPVDAVVYTTLLTLAVFLLFKIPAIWQGVDFQKAKNKEKQQSGGAAAILVGMMTLTIPYSMASTHTWDNVNYADAFNSAMTVGGVILMLLGIGLLLGWRALGGYYHWQEGAREL